MNTVVAEAGNLHKDLPRHYGLDQNYPNPFNPVTVISYRLPERTQVRLSVFDILGREVAALVMEEQPAGEYTVHWNAAGASSGVYYYRIQAGSFIDSKKLLLIR